MWTTEERSGASETCAPLLYVTEKRQARTLSDLFSVAQHRHGDRSCFACALDVADERGELPADLGAHNFLAALWADARRYAFDHYERAFKPEVLLDLSLLHLLAADVTLTVIVLGLVVAHGYSKA